jgi:hypothetical protein
MFVKKNCLSSVAILALAVCAGQANAAPACPSNSSPMTMQGKIFNNAISPGTTLGTVALDLGNGSKLKCGIMGSGGIGADGTTINFIHNLVCDDSVSVTTDTGRTETVHSQITLNTSGMSILQACVPGTPQAGAYGTFTETSVPVPMSGRGIFQGVTGGSIITNGTINCQFALDMKFQGQVCIPNPH